MKRMTQKQVAEYLGDYKEIMVYNNMALEYDMPRRKDLEDKHRKLSIKWKKLDDKTKD